MPYRLRDVKRHLEARGVAVVEAGGRHPYRAERDGKVYPIPAHNGLKSELADVFIRGVCRCFGLDQDAFFRDLRGE
ncbi:MAG: hypothetical protein AMXMBFR64_57560 [Myxococcales bacterium]